MEQGPDWGPVLVPLSSFFWPVFSSLRQGLHAFSGYIYHLKKVKGHNATDTKESELMWLSPLEDMD